MINIDHAYKWLKNINVIIAGDKMSASEKTGIVPATIAACLVCAFVAYFILKIGAFKAGSEESVNRSLAKNVSELTTNSILDAIEKVYSEKTRIINQSFDRFYKTYDSKKIKRADIPIEIKSPGARTSKILPVIYDKKSLISDAQSATEFIYNVKIETGLNAIYYAKTSPVGDLTLVASTIDLQSDFNFFNIKSDDDNKVYANILRDVYLGKKRIETIKSGSDTYIVGFSHVSDYKGEIIGVVALAAWVNTAAEFDKIFARQVSESKSVIVAFTPDDRITCIYPEAKEAEIKNAQFRKDSLLKNSTQAIALDYSAINPVDKNSVGSAAFVKNLNWYVLSEYNTKLLKRASASKPTLFGLADLIFLICTIILTLFFVSLAKKLDKRKNESFARKYDPVFASLSFLAAKHVNEADAILPDVNFNKPDLNDYETLIKNVWTACENFVEIERDNKDLLEILEGTKTSAGAQINELLSQVDAYESEIEHVKRENYTENEFLKQEINALNAKLKTINEVYSSSLNEFTSFKSISLSIISGMNEDPNVKSEEIIKSFVDRIHSSSSGKFNILRDKIDKILVEVNSIKTISERAFLLSVNSAILAEKANAKRLTTFAAEVKKIADKTVSSSDKFNYLVNELRYAIDSLETDYKTSKRQLDEKSGINMRTGRVADKRGTTELINEIERVSSAISLLSRTVNSNTDHTKNGQK